MQPGHVGPHSRPWGNDQRYFLINWVDYIDREHCANEMGSVGTPEMEETQTDASQTCNKHKTLHNPKMWVFFFSHQNAYKLIL